MTKPKVLLTNPIHPGLLPELREHCEIVLAPDPGIATLTKLVADAQAIVVRAQLTPQLLSARTAPKLRAIVRHGVGLDMIPVGAATARGIPVANLPGSNTQAVAEYVMAAMLQLRRGLATMDRVLRSDGWAPSRALADRTLELGGATWNGL
jgi:D-3-phosphoglycerate dehydrogenase